MGAVFSMCGPSVRGGRKMTEEQKKIKKYVNALERNLKLPSKMKARINGDIGTEIHLKLEEGKTVDEVLAELGSPEEVAERFNEEFSDYRIRKSPVRFLFLFLIVLIVLGAVQYGMNLWQISRKMAGIENLIGGADGPTSIFAAGTAVGNGSGAGYWLTSAGLILGCLAGYFLASCGKKGEKKQYLIYAAISAAGLILSIAGPLISGTGDYAQWIMLIGTTTIEVIPGFILNIVTLVISLRWMKKRENGHSSSVR